MMIDDEELMIMIDDDKLIMIMIDDYGNGCDDDDDCRLHCGEEAQGRGYVD